MIQVKNKKTECALIKEENIIKIITSGIYFFFANTNRNKEIIDK